MAMHIPPRVIVLMSIPRASSTMMVASRDTGIAITEMSVVLKLPRKRKRIRITKRAPSSRARPTLPTEAWMKSACWKMWVSTVMSEGRAAAASCTLRSMALVTLRVLMSGCLLTEMMTAGFAFIEAVPRRTAAPVRMVAMSLMHTGSLPEVRTRVAPSSFRSVVRAMPRRAYSLPLSLMMPPSELTLRLVQASSSSAIVTPKASIRRGSARTWYCFSSPPTTVTWDTPPVASIAGLMTQSAMSRSSIIEVLSDCIPMNMISPITLDCGASIGTIPSGSCSPMVTSFSDTV